MGCIGSNSGWSCARQKSSLLVSLHTPLLVLFYFSTSLPLFVLNVVYGAQAVPQRGLGLLHAECELSPDTLVDVDSRMKKDRSVVMKREEMERRGDSGENGALYNGVP